MTISERIQLLSKRQATPFYTYNETQLQYPKLLDKTRYALVHYGLPDNCSPYLNFFDYQNKPIPTLSEYFKLGPSWSNEDRAALDDYLLIGFNGSGDPICIDLANNNRLVYLNHDSDFQPIFINSSVQQFLECLLLIEEVRELDNKEDIERLMDQFRLIDSACVAKGELWYSEVNYLVHEAEE